MGEPGPCATRHLCTAHHPPGPRGGPWSALMDPDMCLSCGLRPLPPDSRPVPCPLLWEVLILSGAPCPPQLAAQSRPILTPLPGVGTQHCIENHSVWKHAPHAAHLLAQPGRPGARSSGCGDCHSPLTCQSVTTLKSRCNQLQQKVRSPSGNKRETACSCWGGGKHSGGTDGGYPIGTLTGSRQQCPGRGLGHRSPEPKAHPALTAWRIQPGRVGQEGPGPPQSVEWPRALHSLP